jgi:hypothetical protein
MATLNEYNVGDLVRLTGEIATLGGIAVDPTTVACKVKPPSGTNIIYTYGADAFPVRVEAGEYYVDVTATEAGEWWYGFFSTGTGQAAEEARFYVVGSHF